MDGVKVQLIWEICQSSFVGYCCLRHGGTFGKLKHPVCTWGIADVPCKVQSGLRRWCSCSCQWKWMSFYYLLLLWAHCCRSWCGSLKPGMACWNLCCGLTQSGPAKTESHPFLHLLAQNTEGMLRAHCISLMLHSVLLVCFYKTPVCFTPQDWILLHVIRNDFAGIHVTKVEFPSFLWKMRAWWEPETYTRATQLSF